MTISTEHIAITPGTLGGKPRIAGHRVSVEHIAIMHEDQGMTPREIVEQLPTITLADVHAALAYFYDHEEEVRRRQRETDAWVEQVRLASPDTPFQQQRRQLGAEHAQVPS